jgi:aminoglycoside 6'-N-acetyltransferase I
VTGATIIRATRNHLAEWTAMRSDLWVDATPAEHEEEILAALAAADDDMLACVALAEDGRPIGFAEASIRHEYVNGCDTSPVAFLEAVYVVPDRRGTGVARALCMAVENWGRERGMTELGSDTDWENPEGRAMHAKLGFEETERVIYYRKAI